MNRYFKRAAIGSGTFGEAWLVTSRCSGRDYVIKEIKVNEMSEDEFNRVRSEVAVLARCKHANIIRYKESFTKQDPFTLCLVMEYADGGDLYEKVKEAKLQGRLIREEWALHWFIQIVFAVQYLHSNNILHRDLKTQNIFLTQKNMVKVGDFGIARFVQNKQDLATTAIGTPYYLSPEICLRRPYNFKSDMWAVGCILFELCSLRHPFEAESFEALIVIILQGNYPPLSMYYSNLVHKLVQVLIRSDPESRPSADLLLTAPALKNQVEGYMKFHDDLINSSQESLPRGSPKRSPNLDGSVYFSLMKGYNSENQTPKKKLAGSNTIAGDNRKRIDSLSSVDERNRTSDYESKSDDTDSMNVKTRMNSGSQTPSSTASDSGNSVDSDEYLEKVSKTAEFCVDYACQDEVFSGTQTKCRKNWIEEVTSPLCKTFIVNKSICQS